MKISDLPDDGSRQKEVFAAYGLAMHYAQLLERTLIQVLLLVDLSPEKHTRRDYDSMESQLGALTAGALVKKLKKRIKVDQITEDALREALTKRNHLAHSFFYANAITFSSDKGMQQMVDYCNDARLQFQKADVILTSLQNILLELNGIDLARLEETVSSLIDEWLNAST